MSTLADLYASAKDADLSDLGADADRWEPEAGLELVVKATHVRQRETKAGKPAWGVRFEVTEGEDQGRSYWHNFNLVDEQHKGLNAAVFHYLKLIGLTFDILSAGLTDEQLDQVVQGSGIELNAKTAYRKNKKGDGRFPNHHYTVVENFVEVPVEDDDDEDVDFDI